MILYKDNKAIGRLVAPIVQTTGAEASTVFTSFQLARTAEKVHLCILVDAAFNTATWQLKIFSSRGSCLSAFLFNGLECSTAIEQHRQREEYIVKQQRKFLAEGGTLTVAKKSDLIEIERGKGGDASGGDAVMEHL